MAERPLDCLANSVQYPLVTPSKRRMLLRVYGFGVGEFAPFAN